MIADGMVMYFGHSADNSLVAKWSRFESQTVSCRHKTYLEFSVTNEQKVAQTSRGLPVLVAFQLRRRLFFFLDKLTVLLENVNIELFDKVFSI
jgi:hypothetical protein